MHIDDFNNAMHKKIIIAHCAHLQIDWVPEGSQPEADVVSSSSNESQDEDEKFFNQEPPENNKTFMNMIWQGMKKTYKLIKGLKKNDTAEPHIIRSCSESGGGKRERHALWGVFLGLVFFF